MKIFFIGTVEFSYIALEALINCGHQVIGVATKESSEFNSDFKDLTPLCVTNNIPYKFVKDINHEKNIDFIKSFEPDIIYCFGWSSLIKKELLNLAKFGVVGFHPALLPLNKGRHPIIWALALGLEQTGSSFFIMDEGADSGDLISQKVVNISKKEDAFSLYNKIIKIAIPQILDFTKKFEEGKVIFKKQPKTLGNNWRKRDKSDGRIDFRMNSQTIFNLVRALSKPYIGAHIETKEGDIKVFESKIIECEFKNIEPGKILELESNWVKVKTADSAIWLKLEIKPDQLINYSYL
jgi:methionyl-tRNA formyltransferase